MKFDPKIHHRRSIRLKGYDYSKEGSYFITVCCHKMKYLFGQVIEGEMILNEYGIAADDQWLDLPNRFPNVELGEHMVMPNHMHGIISIVGATLAVARAAVKTAPTATTTKENKILGDMIGAYKSLTFNDCLKIYKTRFPGKQMGKLWQRDYYEHIIRDKKAYERISNYIINNPKNWKEDRFY